MSNLLYKFLKEKGCEFCYASGKPTLVHPNIPVEWMEEFRNY